EGPVEDRLPRPGRLHEEARVVEGARPVRARDLAVAPDVERGPGAVLQQLGPLDLEDAVVFPYDGALVDEAAPPEGVDGVRADDHRRLFSDGEGGVAAGIATVERAARPIEPVEHGEVAAAGEPGRAGEAEGADGAGVVDAGLAGGDDGGIGLGRDAGRGPVVGVVPGPVAAVPGVADLRGGRGGEEREEEGEGREGVMRPHGREGEWRSTPSFAGT